MSQIVKEETEGNNPKPPVVAPVPPFPPKINDTVPKQDELMVWLDLEGGKITGKWPDQKLTLSGSTSDPKTKAGIQIGTGEILER